MKTENSFIGRKHELSLLHELFEKQIASLVVLRGRRRIGKSRLIEEFGKSKNTYFFEGLAPTHQTSAQSQREDFAHQMQRILTIPLPRADDWGDLLWILANHTKSGKVIIALDEITWLGAKDPTFLGKLKTTWDLYFKKNKKLILILTGSMSGWIEKNILSSTGFFGRITLDLKLEELPLKECARFWKTPPSLISAYEKFIFLSVSGGVPRYLEEMNPKLPANENIRRMCFRKEGILFNEFNRIFLDLFGRRNNQYEKIIKRLAEGSANLNQICDAIKAMKSGVINEYLDDLLECGYISRDYTWNLSSGKSSSLSLYRLCDNYLRFYLKVILPNQDQIKRNAISNLPNWESILGLQFENLVLNNRKKIYHLLGIKLDEITNDNPYFQRQTTKQAGCQIDYLIQTRFQTLYICEIKFSKNKIGPKVCAEVQKKIELLKAGKSFSCRPVLIHVNGVTEALLDKNYFAKIIDFSELLH